MEQELFELLTKRSKRSFDGYEKTKTISDLSIPGELAFFLDDLMETAVKRLGRTAEDTIADVIEKGIVAWYRSLTPQVAKDLDIPELAQALEAPVVAEPEKKPSFYDEDEDPNDPDPAAAQRLADSYSMENDAFGYTPLTLHGIGNNSANANAKRRPGAQAKNIRSGQQGSPMQGQQNRNNANKSRNRGRRRKAN